MQQINRYVVENLGTREVNVLTDQDQKLVTSFNLNSVSFNPDKHTLDLNVYSLGENYLETFYNIGDYTVEGTVVDGGPTHIVVDPVASLESRGYLGDVIVEFDAFNNLFSPRKVADSQAYLFISEFSSDRTEIRAQSTTISDNALKNYANQLYSRFNENSYFSEVYLRFAEQHLDLPCINVITEVIDGIFYVTFKLYKPVPNGIEVKTRFSVQERVGEPTRFQVIRNVEVIEDSIPHLKGPNFEIDLEQQRSLTSKYYNLEQLFSYPVSSSRYDLLSLYRENSAEIGLDFTNFSEFVHFSSAEERLENFRYKLELVVGYEKTIAELSDRSYVDPDIELYKNLRDGVLANFDPYERFLYFTDDPKAWPKVNGTKPYVCVDPEETRIDGTPANLWWTNLISEAQEYDEHNHNALINAVPEDIRSNVLNDAFVAFVHMVGQHFDEQWTYAKAIADRYNTDNRLNYGISKDLVKEALQGFGLTLQESNQNLVDLFNQCNVNGSYDCGSEAISVFNRITVEMPIYVPVHTYDDEDAARTVISTIIDGKYATSSGSVDGYVFGPVKIQMNADVSGTLEGIGSGQFSGSYNGEPISGSLTGSLSGSFDGHFSNFNLTGNISASVQGTVSGSFFDGAVVDGGPANFNTVASTDNQPMTVESYRREIYKRIYHNLPYLIKTKGTARGLRALINCFGIPDDILEIDVLGNVDTQAVSYVGPDSKTTSSLDRVRIASASSAPIYLGGFEDPSTLSGYAKTKKLVQTHSDSSHEIHVGFNLNKQADELFTQYLVSRSVRYDDLIGDPGKTEENYESTLGSILNQAVADNADALKLLHSPSGIIRLVRYIDSMLFRAIQEIIPARSELQTGVVVEDNILHRNRYKGVDVSGTEKQYQGEIRTGFITGSDSKAMDYVEPVDWKPEENSDYEANEPKFDGELVGSEYEVTDGEVIKRNFWEGNLIDGNPFKHATEGRMRYYVNMKFLSLPKQPVCNMGLESAYLGKVFEVYSNVSYRGISYRADDGLWINGGSRSSEITDVLDGGNRAGGMTQETIDSGRAILEPDPFSALYIVGQSGLVPIEYVGNKHINQIELGTTGTGTPPPGARAIFAGWYEGLIATDLEVADSVENFISSQQNFVVTQDTAQEQYTAWFIEMSNRPGSRIPLITDVSLAIGTGSKCEGVGSALPTIPEVTSAKYAIVIDGYKYEAEYPINGGRFVIDTPMPVTSISTIQKQGFSEITMNGRKFTPESGLVYLMTVYTPSLVESRQIPWISIV